MGNQTQPSSNEILLNIPIEGMSCAACAQRLEKALNRTKGIQATVNFATETAQVISHTDQRSTIESVIKKAGFTIALQTYTFTITGMSCVACATRIEKQLAALQPQQAHVNFATETATITVPAGLLSPDLILQTIAKAGYTAQLLVDKHQHTQSAPQFPWLLVLAIACTSPFMYEMLMMLRGQHGMLPVYIQLILASIVQFIVGARFYLGAYLALRGGAANMDVLVALGTSAAWGYSVWGVFVGQHALYFEASAMVITLVLLGKWLEARAKAKTGAALEALLQLQPQTARVLKNETWLDLPISQIEVGDIIQLRDGETVPIDGQLLQGQVEIDEAMLTGESVSIHKNTGDMLYAGTKNLAGSAQIKASAVGAQTQLAAIVNLVEQAQGSKAPIQQLADRISAIFVPVILVIALATLLATYAFTADFTSAIIHAVAVLVIACPCALGLATPAAVMVGVGLGAQHGILFRNATALELASQIDTLIVDKTGTLTLGQAQLLKTIKVDSSSYSEADIVQLAASLESSSQHPLAHAFIQANQRDLLNASQVQSTAACGIEGRVADLELRIGKPEWIATPSQLAEHSNTLHPYSNEGNTIIAISINTHIAAYFILQDQIRPSSFEAIQKLQNAGVEVLMLTGDNAASATRVATALGIHNYQAQCTPQDKYQRLLALQQAGKKVAMVGDGVNDAPALAAADVSFAMKSGASVALETADITLIHNDIAHINAALSLSRATLRKIRQNLFFAFIYNILGIPLAALGLLSPVIAGAAMALSSVSVISNALLLKRFKWQD